MQAACTNIETFLSHTASRRGRDPGKFNFDMGTEGERGQQDRGKKVGGSGMFVVLYGK